MEVPPQLAGPSDEIKTNKKIKRALPVRNNNDLIRNNASLGCSLQFLKSAFTLIHPFLTLLKNNFKNMFLFFLIMDSRQ